MDKKWHEFQQCPANPTDRSGWFYQKDFEGVKFFWGVNTFFCSNRLNRTCVKTLYLWNHPSWYPDSSIAVLWYPVDSGEKLKPSRRKWLNFALNNKQTYKRLYKQLERFPARSKWSALTSTTTVIYIKTRIINKKCQSEFTVSRLWETKLRGLSIAFSANSTERWPIANVHDKRKRITWPSLRIAMNKTFNLVCSREQKANQDF